MSNISLYEAANQLAPLLDSGIDPETGEMSEELIKALSQFEGKGQSVAAYVLNCEATAEMIYAAADKMAKRAEPLKKRAERMRQYLSFHMKQTGTASITADDKSFQVRLLVDRDEAVEVFNEEQIPLGYMETPPQPPAKPDKVAIKKSIKAGTDVPGAKIIRRDRLEIK